MRSVHSFLSPLGIGITMFIFIGLGFSFWQNGGQMFSPGKLTSQGQEGLTLGDFAAHADFETQCEYCHAPLETIQADLCLSCHTTVFEQVISQTGTHGSLPDIQQCRSCHPDHLGRDADITAAAFTYFDHQQTGFSLRWHQLDYDSLPMDCYACHTRDGGFQLEPKACQDCHAGHDQVFMSAHLGDFGTDCMDCPDGEDHIANFDHTATRFPLEGEHAQLSCAGCHLEGRFEGAPLDCAACHLEPEVHAGLFSQDCSACHTPEHWSALVGLQGEWFDHFKQTRFSLDRHFSDYAGDSIQCAGCHTAMDGFKLGFDLDFCLDCHTVENPSFMADHQARFGLDCLSCHDGFDRMVGLDHNLFFVLDGQHATTACESCHVNRVFQDTPSECVACHLEPEIHAGYFGLVCDSCHSTSAWAPAKLVSHIFPLDHGEQGLVACEVCHTDRYTAYTCYDCHEHSPEEMIEKHQEEGITGARLEDCVACHPTGLEAEDD